MGENTLTIITTTIRAVERRDERRVGNPVNDVGNCHLIGELLIGQRNEGLEHDTNDKGISTFNM